MSLFNLEDTVYLIPVSISYTMLKFTSPSSIRCPVRCSPLSESTIVVCLRSGLLNVVRDELKLPLVFRGATALPGRTLRRDDTLAKLLPISIDDPELFVVVVVAVVPVVLDSNIGGREDDESIKCLPPFNWYTGNEFIVYVDVLLSWTGLESAVV